MNQSVTPSGVEHPKESRMALAFNAVNQSVTPSGVEHTGAKMFVDVGNG